MSCMSSSKSRHSMQGLQTPVLRICGTSFSELWNFYFRLPLLIRKGLNRWRMQHDQYFRHTLPTVTSAHNSHEQKVVSTLPTLLILEERQWNLVPHKLLFLHITTPVLSKYLTVSFSLCLSAWAKEENSLQSLLSSQAEVGRGADD